MGQEPLTERQKITLWFVHLRWGALLVMLAVVLTSVYPGRLHFPLFQNLLIIGIACLYNLLYPTLVRRFRIFSENTIFTYLRVTVDLIVVTLAVHFTGGVESPFKLLYLLEFTAIAITGFERIAYPLAAQASIMYLFTTIPEALGLIKHYRLVDGPGTLYLNINYGVSKALALVLCSWLIIYITSFLADRLREKQKQIEVLSTAQLDFMNIVIHEIKSPLTSIIGYSELMADQRLGPIGDQQKEPLAIIKRQSHRILDLVADLLTLARLESGRANIDKQPVNLADIANRVIEELHPSLDARRLSIINEFDPRTPPVNADEDRIHQVLTNLLVNAMKFSNEQGKIFVSVRPEAKEVLFTIRDEGLGIAPIDLPHIYEKFYRASKESAERKGTGLGLTVCKLIVEAHDGRIWAASAGPGQGAVFYFTLPL